MITNFEEITKELSGCEKLLLEPLTEIYESASKENPIKTDKIVRMLKAQHPKITGVRLRKLNNFIRCNRILPLIGTSNGYYLSNDQDEIEREIKSLRERANSINDAADGLTSFLNSQLKFL